MDDDHAENGHCGGGEGRGCNGPAPKRARPSPRRSPGRRSRRSSRTTTRSSRAPPVARGGARGDRRGGGGEVSLVDNATTAAAIVLQHVAWSFTEGAFRKGDAVVMLHYAYGAVKKSIQAYVARAGAEVIEVPLPFPVSSDADIVREFRGALDRGKAGGRRVRLAVIDHITSMPSVVIPVKELTRICREEGVDQVFVDAAHAIGNVPVDVEDIGADFYTSNLHKWFFCPPPSPSCTRARAPIPPTCTTPSSPMSTGTACPWRAAGSGQGTTAPSSWSPK
uniref:Aminotransferase class V domain-containing protein n=1 Tax=Ananas comosus var. bracteatus TaxID=296719 RepID=A0A6V7PCM7_ANACO|nr:unnamed protein product [Ananas comosus var. bracteatus]